jgi:DNA-binding NarL/FixJ family response regulator
VRVAIAEDSVLLRDGVARILGDNGFEVVAQCGDAEDLLLKVNSYPLDVAIVDIRLPPTHKDEGVRAALEIRARHPSVGVLVLSQYIELGLAMKLLADSAEGVRYLLKHRVGDVRDFVAAVRRVAEGGSALDPVIVSTLLARWPISRDLATSHPPPRRLRLMRLAIQIRLSRSQKTGAPRAGLEPATRGLQGRWSRDRVLTRCKRRGLGHAHGPSTARLRETTTAPRQLWSPSCQVPWGSLREELVRNQALIDAD